MSTRSRLAAPRRHSSSCIVFCTEQGSGYNGVKALNELFTEGLPLAWMGEERGSEGIRGCAMAFQVKFCNTLRLLIVCSQCITELCFGS
ncbi:hypothetical protein JZ751_027927 [Albula glossodonta]|uniref:Uncharacterized protein n=1 Tax=Albula glossodonta TaxID=121402 RepID=A0A8T2PIM7_9TELE|nr:hypothetical protein JZ751_027927 [Albula glossodonta]